MNQELRRIKKLYGEQTMHFCRDNFSTILEIPGKLSRLLEENIAPTKSLIKDIKDNHLEDDFKSFIYELSNLKEPKKTTKKTPYELLRSVGYTLYECKTEEDIQKFKRYYADREKLCTFKGGRLNFCHVFFAVKDNADRLNRSNFNNPERQDKYGTSVISIQFSKGKTNTLSIKNRYNHSVNNPDATYSNNLENIVEGLTDSFEREYNLNITQNYKYYSCFLTDYLNYVKASDGKFYRYNMEIGDNYYCENNIIISHGNVIDKYFKEKERYILMDYFIFDLKEKCIKLYDPFLKDSFCNTINIGIDKIIVNKTKDGKELLVKVSNGFDIKIVLDRTNNIIEYENTNITRIDSNFLNCNELLNKLVIPNVRNICDNFLRTNKSITQILLPNVKAIGDNFLARNKIIDSINLDNVEIIGDNFLLENNELNSLNLPSVRSIGLCFMYYNRIIRDINLPMVEVISDDFMMLNNELKDLNLPKVKIIGSFFLSENTELEIVSMPEVKIIGSSFIEKNEKIKELNMNNVKYIGGSFLEKNIDLVYLYMPNLERIGTYFMTNNRCVKYVYTPKISELNPYFLFKYNKESNRQIKDFFIKNNPNLTGKEKKLIYKNKFYEK